MSYARFDDALLVARRFEYFLKSGVVFSLREGLWSHWGTSWSRFWVSRGHLGVTLVSEKHFGGVWESILDLPGAILESFWGPKSKEFRGSVSESFFSVFF